MVEIVPRLLYSSHDLTDLLGVSLDHLSRARDDGELQFTQPGDQYIYFGHWVLEWLEKTVQGHSEEERQEENEKSELVQNQSRVIKDQVRMIDDLKRRLDELTVDSYICNLDLMPRYAGYICIDNDVMTPRNLSKKTRWEVLSWKGIGEATCRKMENALGRYGLTFSSALKKEKQ